MNTNELPRFGIEIETVGLHMTDIARAIQSVVGGSIGGYTGTVVTAADGREWKVVRDGSLNGYANGEIVSPILSYTDLDALQNIVRAVRAAGARTDESCGIHIHVDGQRFDARTLLNLVNMVHKQERLIERALGVSGRRLEQYTRSIRAEFVQRLEAKRPKTLDEFKAAWYLGRESGGRYDSTRYHGINLNSFFYRGTIEFRYFNGTLHAGEVKAYVQFVLALANRALNAKATSRARRVIDEANEKWAFRVFMKMLGMVGPEFKTARLHLMKKLPGTSENPGRTRQQSAPIAEAS